MYGGYTFGVRVKGGTLLLDFANDFYLVLANTGIHQREDHLGTFQSRVSKT